MQAPPKYHPPEWPLKLLRFFLKKEYVEEIEGDMEEAFQDNAEQFSLKKAKRIYTREMLSLLRPVLLNNFDLIHSVTQIGMFRNYFKVSFRGLKKNPMSSLINIVGLSIAIGICVFIYAFTSYVISTDQFHVNKDNVFLVTSKTNRDGTNQWYGKTPRPLGDLLRTDNQHLKNICRIEDRKVVVKFHNHVFHERIRFVDPSFLELFTFPLKWGVSNSLSDVNSVILSEPMSEKYFGKENPIGQDLILKFNETTTKVFKVAGVAEKFPVSRSFSFDFLINFENFKTSESAYRFDDWNAYVNATFIQITNPYELASILHSMDKYKELQNRAVKEDWAISSFGLEPLATLHKNAEHIKEGIIRSSESNYSSIYYLLVVGSILMALACFNYINIAIVSAAKRLKEIGVRKTIGASRKTVIIQFLSENIVITFFAMLFGLFLGITFFIPGFEGMWHFSMGFSLFDARLWIFLPAILLFTAIASGIYPAFYISRFQVVKIIKGSVQFGQKNPVTKFLLTFQLILSCLFITCAVMFTQNTAYLSKRSWGYNPKEVLYISTPEMAAFDKFNDELEKNPDVLKVSGSSDHVGRSNSTAIIHVPEREYEVDELSVDAYYFETLGIPLKEGRSFRDRSENDRHTIIINESLAESLSLSHPIGSLVKIDSIQFEIIGVTKDFHSFSFFEKVNPTIFKVASKEDYRYISLRVQPGTEQKTYAALRTQWARLYPETPFIGGYQEDVWGNYFVEIEIHSTVWIVLGFIAILLACLGLYGLITINVAGRVREFSIRKVLGAGLKNITGLITRQYLVLFSIALIIGAPLSYVLIKMVISTAYAYHMPITFSGTAIAIFILLTVLIGTVSTQVYKVSRDNAIDGLKSE